MRWVIAAVLVDVILLVPITSMEESIGGEFVTGFEADVLEGGGDTHLVVKNTGPLQATGVVLDGTIDGLSHLGDGRGCPEGIVTLHGDYVHATFDRMTPNRECRLALAPPNADLSSIRITADGYYTVWSPASAEIVKKILANIPTWHGLLFILFVAWNALLLVYVLSGTRQWVLTLVLGCRRFKWWLNDRERPILQHADEVAGHLRKEYKIVAGKDEAAVVIVVLCGKDTLGQIIRHTGMARGRAEHVLQRLRNEGIIAGEKIALVESLDASLRKRAAALCRTIPDSDFSIDSDA